MIRGLRRRHLEVWILLAVLIPVGIIFAWLAIPNPEPIKLLGSSATKLLPVIKSTNETTNYAVNLRTNEEMTQWQLEWKNKTPLTVPSAVIYRTFYGPSSEGVSNSFNPEGSEIVGRIEARGNYVFALRIVANHLDELNLVIYDFIHKKTINTIIFKFPPAGKIRRGL